MDVSYVDKLYSCIVKIKNKNDCKIFLEDLLSQKELEQMAQRIFAAECLLGGDTYEEVIEKTKISSATLSRVSKCVKLGEGYKKFVKPSK